MLTDILVTSNFPDVLSCGVEYTVSFQLLMDERRDCTLHYTFSDDSIVKRRSKKEERGTFFYNDLSVTFVLKGTGVHTFSILLENYTIYEKSFIVEEIIDPIYYENEIEEPLYLRTPDNIVVERLDNVFTFTCAEIPYEHWLRWYHTQDIKQNNKIYCGIRYFAPERSTHWRIKTKSSKGIQDSHYMEFTQSDRSMVDWYFPIAEILKDKASITENTYEQSIAFYVKCGNEYVELDYNEYTINIIPTQKQLNNTIWNNEILRLIYLIREDYQTKDLIRKYGVWHSLSEEEILSDIRRYKDNFGEFALNKGLIETTNQAILLNYATHYTLIDSIIKLGITDLKQTREDFQDLMLQANKGICEVLPQIK
jgi:hypothetical protein